MREKGYYWVKHEGEWMIAFWYGPNWELGHWSLEDKDFDEIDERRLVK